jgi:hypothetical protein
VHQPKGFGTAGSPGDGGGALPFTARAVAVARGVNVQPVILRHAKRIPGPISGRAMRKLMHGHHLVPCPDRFHVTSVYRQRFRFLLPFGDCGLSGCVSGIVRRWLMKRRDVEPDRPFPIEVREEFRAVPYPDVRPGMGRDP